MMSLRRIEDDVDPCELVDESDADSGDMYYRDGYRANRSHYGL